jgi:hypothetical protein
MQKSQRVSPASLGPAPRSCQTQRGEGRWLHGQRHSEVRSLHNYHASQSHTHKFQSCSISNGSGAQCHQQCGEAMDTWMLHIKKNEAGHAHLTTRKQSTVA